MELQDDDRIVRGLKRGRQRAWQDLHDAYATRLWQAVARLMPGDATAVGDMVQETFMEAARSAGNYEHMKGSLWQWLYGIARHRVARFYRREAQQHRLKQIQNWWVSIGSDAHAWACGETATPDAILEATELTDLVRITLAALREDYALLLTARYFDGYSAVEIARQNGATPEATRAKLLRARRKFREGFLKHVESETHGNKEVHHGRRTAND